jgi:hypothetical protein
MVCFVGGGRGAVVARRAAFVIALAALVACGFVVSSTGDEPGGTSTSSSGSSGGSSSGTSSSGGSEVDGPANESSTAADAGDAGSLDDAPYDGPCPDACTSCTPTRCTITCPGPKCEEKIVRCPPALDCHITCTGMDSCKGSDRKFICPPGKACTMICNGNKACEDAELDGRDASSFCVDCIGNNSCNNTDCKQPTTCFCGAGECPCSDCTDIPACPP